MDSKEARDTIVSMANDVAKVLRLHIVKDIKKRRLFKEQFMALVMAIEALNKQIPKKARYDEKSDRHYCPVCGASVDWDGTIVCEAYCDECGQRLE